MPWSRPIVLVACVTLGCGGTPPGPSPNTGTQAAPARPAATCSAPVTTGDPNTSSPPRCISFAGYEWAVKASPRFDPGPNAWADGEDNVFVDALGLHLRITNAGGIWRSSEVVLNGRLGYGRYAFRTETNVAELDPSVVLGFFTYDYRDPAFGHREIDIEFSPMLGFTPGANAHFTVQPFQARGHTHDFTVRPENTGNVHSFEWRAGRVTFQSGAEQWTFSGPDVPTPGAENVRINLWLFGGRPPAGAQPPEVIVSGFEFNP